MLIALKQIIFVVLFCRVKLNKLFFSCSQVYHNSSPFWNFLKKFQAFIFIIIDFCKISKQLQSTLITASLKLAAKTYKFFTSITINMMAICIANCVVMLAFFTHKRQVIVFQIWSLATLGGLLLIQYLIVGQSELLIFVMISPTVLAHPNTAHLHNRSRIQHASFNRGND